MNYVWFPLVPHWDVLSIAWKCSKYRFWVCSNDLILRTSPLWRFSDFFSKWCSKYLSVAIYKAQQTTPQHMLLTDLFPGTQGLHMNVSKPMTVSSGGYFKDEPKTHLFIAWITTFPITWEYVKLRIRCFGAYRNFTTTQIKSRVNNFLGCTDHNFSK